MLEHGGRLHQAVRNYGIPFADWLDLSTGINPCGWPVPEPPRIAWARLPEAEDGLGAAARAYYGTRQLLAVAGSQAAIQALPRLRDRSRVSVLTPGYAEHAQAWQCAGHRVTPVAAEQLGDAVSESDVLVLIHPNNPTGTRFPLDELLDWQARLAARAGWLVVDEAFMDATPDTSLARFCPRPGLIVLRSLGKFFGLAGARVGFVLAQSPLLEKLDALLGPWAVSAPSRWVATQALADRDWQQGNRRHLATVGERLRAVLTRYGLSPDGGCSFFQWVRTPEASRLQDRLARRGILTRLFTAPPSLRFGLPGTEADWNRLEAVLAGVTECRDVPFRATEQHPFPQ